MILHKQNSTDNRYSTLFKYRVHLHYTTVQSSSTLTLEIFILEAIASINRTKRNERKKERKDRRKMRLSTIFAFGILCNKVLESASFMNIVPRTSSHRHHHRHHRHHHPRQLSTSTSTSTVVSTIVIHQSRGGRSSTSSSTHQHQSDESEDHEYE